MRHALVALLLLVACKEKESKPSGVSAYPVPEAACKRAIEQATNAPLNARPAILIEGCAVCPGWNTILTWNREGTKPEQLQAHLEDCKAFCTGDAKMKFIAQANKAKGSSNDTAWRRLADACGDRVDASSDHRFMSAPYFMLDRIGRALGAKLDAITLPLPALTVAGTGLVLPELDTDVAPDGTVFAITLIGDAIHVGKLPRAKLSASGVNVDLGTPPYPGDDVKLEQLAEAITNLVGQTKAQVALLAPREMPAAKLVPIIAVAGPVAPLYLGATSPESPAGWQLPGAVPYPLQVGKDGINVTAEMTVQNLASEIIAKRSGTLTAP